MRHAVLPHFCRAQMLIARRWARSSRTLWSATPTTGRKALMQHLTRQKCAGSDSDSRKCGILLRILIVVSDRDLRSREGVVLYWPGVKRDRIRSRSRPFSRCRSKPRRRRLWSAVFDPGASVGCETGGAAGGGASVPDAGEPTGEGFGGPRIKPGFGEDIGGRVGEADGTMGSPTGVGGGGTSGLWA
jgi:hypothetical protein